MIGQQQLSDTVIEVLKNLPNKPFLCLPLSALFYVLLKDNHNVESQLVTGNLFYKDNVIFKQDFKIENVNADKLIDWSGHAWVELDNQIFDLSFFRTLYSDQFSKPCKKELIQYYGEGRGCIIGSPQELKNDGLSYQAIDCLQDTTATSILKGIKKLPI